jgi:hypothetical protein
MFEDEECAIGSSARRGVGTLRPAGKVCRPGFPDSTSQSTAFLVCLNPSSLFARAGRSVVH